MDKKTKRKIIRISAFIFWTILVILARSERLKQDKNPYIYGILVVSLIGYIIYENFYRVPKIEKTKKKVRGQQLSELLNEKEKYEPKINPDSVPSSFKNYVPLAIKWGISNVIIREHIYDQADKSELLELKKIEKDKEEIEEWINTGNAVMDEKKAFELTLQAYEDLGLWTWDNSVEELN